MRSSRRRPCPLGQKSQGFIRVSNMPRPMKPVADSRSMSASEMRGMSSAHHRQEHAFAHRPFGRSLAKPSAKMP